ncbi:MAG TPA: serine protease [Terriglobales bacterium]
MTDNVPEAHEEPVCKLWQYTVQATAGVFVILSAILIAHYYPSATPPPNNLQQQVQTLSNEVQQLKQEQAMPTLVLNRYRDSICYIYGTFRVGYDGQRPSLRARISGTGFLVGDHLVATNRHVAEPWYQDPDSMYYVHRGAKPKLEKLLAFFPGQAEPVDLTTVEVSDQGDLAIASINNFAAIRHLRPLPLAENAPAPGELVAVVGYPMGVLGMVAKAPNAVYDRLAYRPDDQNAANELAALSLIRPSATCGHLGDVVGDKLIYDAPTAHGGSGGPVFDSRGEVIGVNAAFLDGFSGGTLGVSVRALKPLIAAAQSDTKLTVVAK